MSHHDTPLLPPLTSELWPASLADLEGAFCGRLNVYRTMAHHPALVRAWVDLRQHIVIDTSLGRDLSEVVILRAATNLSSSYEWDSHVVRARALGFSDTRIRSLRGSPSMMERDDAVLAQAVDDLMNGARLAPDTLSALTELVGTQGVLDLMATVGFYSTLGFILNTFGTPLDQEVAASLTEKPFSPDGL
jgi:4-carboxymuconolactone decarboxylase